MSEQEKRSISNAIVKLMQGVVYRSSHEDVWRTLDQRSAAVRDHFSMIGVGVIIDETEGYAYLKSSDPAEGEDPLPRLVHRRALTYHVSLLLLLLRKRLAEFEASGDQGKLVIEHSQIVEMLRVYLLETTNEVRVLQQADQTITQIAKLGFLHEMKQKGGSARAWEVRRILKAYVDAETMADFSSRLAEYVRAHAPAGEPPLKVSEVAEVAR